MTIKLLDLLKALNRKERFFLVGDALGNPEFKLSAEYRSRLKSQAGIEVPLDAWVAMDYHLDWISAALHVWREGTDGSGPWRNERIGHGDVVRGNQEDVDLIIGFERDGIVHLVMIEAKLDSGWTNGQLNSKAKRLEDIFGKGGDRVPGVKPWFVVTSEKRSVGLKTEDLPGWMLDSGKLRFAKLEAAGERRRLYRSDERGRISSDGGWAVIK